MEMIASGIVLTSACPSDALREAFAKRTEMLLQDLQCVVDAQVEEIRRELLKKEADLQHQFQTEAAKLEVERARLEEDRLALLAEEAAFEAEKARFQGQGCREDVLELNVCGQAHCSVTRATLCIERSSMLASMFSGRWDASLAKDAEGHFFIDSPADIFLPLVDFLRRKSFEICGSPAEVPELPPDRAPAFEQLLHYFGLNALLCPLRKWELEYGDAELSGEGFSASTRHVGDCAAALPCTPAKPCTWTFEIRKTEASKEWFQKSLGFAVRSRDAPCLSSRNQIDEIAMFSSRLAHRDQACIFAEVTVRGGSLDFRIKGAAKPRGRGGRDDDNATCAECAAETSEAIPACVTEQPYRLVGLLAYPWIQVRVLTVRPWAA